MTDVFSKVKRSEIMRKIKGANTVPEMLVRSMIHRMGYRFRLHSKELPGRPDIVLPKHRKVIFVNGCFWHRHYRCNRATLPDTNKTFWEKKIDRNVERDKEVRKKLRAQGWKVLTIWQCQIKNPTKMRRKIESFLEM